jgi:hypothetical protein
MSDSMVIMAFVDGEPFDPAALANALSDPSGRQLLLDLMAVGDLVRSEHPESFPTQTTAESGSRLWVRLSRLAALVVLCVSVGYAAGALRTQDNSRADRAASPPAPAPTVVIPRTPDSHWDVTKGQ